MIYTVLLYLLTQYRTQPQPPQPNPAYFDLSVQVTNGAAGGSGTIFQVCGRDSLVLTCGHIFREGDGPITVTRRDGTTSPGRLWAVAASVDLAAVLIPTPADALELYAAMNGGQRASNWELVISNVDPREILALGWGTGQIALHRGSYLGPIGTHEEYTITPRSGDSGGGAWSPDGEFAGVIVWVDATQTSGGIIGPAAVRQFYESIHLGRRRRAA